MNAALGKRLAALEMKSAPVTRPLLFVGRADLDDETDAIWFQRCPIVRAAGEAWATCKDRFAAWAGGQPEFVAGHIQYRDGH